MAIQTELCLGHRLYFSPYNYLIDYAQNYQLTGPAFMQKSNLPPMTQQKLINGQLLNPVDCRSLHQITNISAKTWQNLDKTWQTAKRQQNQASEMR